MIDETLKGRVKAWGEIDARKMLKTWDTTDTSTAATWDDDTLLHQLRFVQVSEGWGVVAELAKRYAALTRAIVEVRGRGAKHDR